MLLMGASRSATAKTKFGICNAENSRGKCATNLRRAEERPVPLQRTRDAETRESAFRAGRADFPGGIDDVGARRKSATRKQQQNSKRANC
jgi:hypothetical protein